MTTPSTPTSTMKEAAPTLADLDAVIARWQALHDTADEFSDDPDMDRSEFAVTLKHLRAYRSLVEAQPCAVAGEAVRMLTDKEMGDVVERSDGAEHSDDEFAHAAIRKFCEVNGIAIAGTQGEQKP